MPTLNLVRKQQLHKVANHNTIIVYNIILLCTAPEPVPPTAPVTTTDIQGVTAQADNQGENGMWWSRAHMQSQKCNNQQTG